MAKILVVEDHKEQAENLCKFLQSQGHSVDVVYSGEDALHLLATYAYEMLILDWELPGISGLDVCAKYRHSGAKGLVLMLTARSDVPSKESGLDTGADDYLTKPYDLRELGARLRSMLRRPADTLITKLQGAGVELDTGARVAVVGEHRVELTQREYALLEYLLRHQDKIFSAKTLLDLVWPVESALSEDTVRSVMRNLRKKLSVSGKQIIETASSSGYVIRSTQPN